MFRRLTAVVVVFAFVFSGPRVMPAAAADHVVPPHELEQRLVDDERSRRVDIADLDRLFATNAAQQSLESAGISSREVRLAVPQLDDDSLAELAAKARAIEQDPSGGIVGGLIMLLVLVLALAVLYIVYVAD